MMRLIALALLLASACHARGGADESAPPTPLLAVSPEQIPEASAPPAAEGAPAAACDADAACQSDADCACGRDAEGRCAVGPVACIDPSDPCPDFCSGITGRMTTVCRDGQCVQSHP